MHCPHCLVSILPWTTWLGATKLYKGSACPPRTRPKTFLVSHPRVPVHDQDTSGRPPQAHQWGHSPSLKDRSEEEVTGEEMPHTDGHHGAPWMMASPWHPGLRMATQPCPFLTHVSSLLDSAVSSMAQGPQLLPLRIIPNRTQALHFTEAPGHWWVQLSRHCPPLGHRTRAGTFSLGLPMHPSPSTVIGHGGERQSK